MTDMEYRPLGRTGVQVSKLCLGTMMFGAWGNTDHDDSIRIIHRALDAGINFVDTADVYSAGESEEIVGKALRGRRDDVVLATKFYVPMGDDPNQRGSSRRWIITEVENFDMSLPENQRKLEAVEQLAKVAGDAGLSLIDLAIAFVVNNPAVTSAIIGPRTMEQLDSQLPAADVALAAAVLDRVDEIVRPGVNLNPADTSYGEQVLAPALRRR